MKLSNSQVTIGLAVPLLLVRSVESKCGHVSSFTLVDAMKRKDIGKLPPTLVLSDYPTNSEFNIRVNVQDDTCERRIQSVFIKYTSTAEPTRSVCDNWLPFTVFGDKNDPRGPNISIEDQYWKVRYVPHRFPNIPANATVVAIPFYKKGCIGASGRGKRKHFVLHAAPAAATLPQDSTDFYSA